MSQDSSNASAKQEIDLDDLEVEIMIIAKNPKTLAQASAFLTRRGWPTTAISNLGQAIELAAEKKPDFVLVSLNHQNPSLPKFIDLVKSTFNSTIVAFIENMDSASNQKLNKSGHQYKVFGQMSGPNLHRSIRRILAEKLNIGQDDKSADDGKKSRDKDDNNISIKGGGAADGRTMIQKSDQGATQGKGPIMIQSERPDAQGNGADSEEVLSAGKYKMGRANRRSLKDFAAEQSSANASGDTFVSPTGKESKDLAAKMRESLFGQGEAGKQAANESNHDDNAAYFSPSEPGVSPNFKNSKDAKESNRPKLSDLEKNREQSQQNQSQAQTQGPTQGQDGRTKWNAITQASSTKDPKKDSADGGNVSHELSTAQLSALSKEAYKGAGDTTAIGRSDKKDGAATGAKANSVPTLTQTMIEKAVQSALSRICQPGDGTSQAVELIENVGVFPVDSPAMPGYLVLAWPNAEIRAEEAFFKLAQETLKTVFQELGVQARLEHGFFVEIPRVDYMTWTNEAAFNMSHKHRDRELGVAFFSTKKPIPKALPVEGNAMYSIGVDHITTERPVTFKAYLHLKKNNKFFLYLRNGRTLAPEQQKRLKDNNVKDFYMKSVDIENLRAFLASSYLSQTIKKSSGNSGSSAA